MSLRGRLKRIEQQIGIRDPQYVKVVEADGVWHRNTGEQFTEEDLSELKAFLHWEDMPYGCDSFRKSVTMPEGELLAFEEALGPHQQLVYVRFAEAGHLTCSTTR